MNAVAPRPVGERTALETYRREKLELADCLLTLLHVVEARHDDDQVVFLRSLAGRLAEDRFQLAVVGQFSRGKSTLMNAILGAPYLPTGALPMTSVITTVVYGSEPKATVFRADRGNSLPIQTTIGNLERYVAQASTEREELRVASALVELPAEILRLGFSFVDTPGVGSAITENTATTVGFLPEADAVVFVTSFDSPITEAELTFLKDVRREVGRIFVVLNKADLVTSPEERADVEAFVSARLGEVGLAGTEVFSISARDGLLAKQEVDARRFAESGVAKLEAALISYLTTARASEFLLAVADRALRVLRVLTAETTLVERTQGDDSAREHLDSALRASLERAGNERERLLSQITARVNLTLAADLPAQVDEWRSSARTLLDDNPLTTTRGPVFGRAKRRQSIARARRATDEALGKWFSRVGREWLETIVGALAPELTALSVLAPSLESDMLRAALPELASTLDAPGTTPRDPPDVTWAGMALAVATKDAPRGTVRPVLAEERIDALEHELRHTLDNWVQALDCWSAEALGEASDQIRKRLAVPDSPQLATELGTLVATIAAVRSRVSSWSTVSAEDAASEAIEPTELSSAEKRAARSRVRGVHCAYDRALQVHGALSVRTRNTNRATDGSCEGEGVLSFPHVVLRRDRIANWHLGVVCRASVK